MPYFDVKPFETDTSTQSMLEYIQLLSGYIVEAIDVQQMLSVGWGSISDLAEPLGEHIGEMIAETESMRRMAQALSQVVMLYRDTEKKLLPEEKESGLDKFNRKLNDINLRVLALGNGLVDAGADLVGGIYKLAVEPTGRLGKLFIDWNRHGFGAMPDEEWYKSLDDYCTYGNNLTSGISNAVLNVFNFKDLEKNTILSPFAYCWNHFGEYISEDASFDDMVSYSKNAVNAVLTVEAGKQIAKRAASKLNALESNRLPVATCRGQYSFDLNGNEVSCLSDFYQVEDLMSIEDARFYNQPKFYEVKVQSGGSVYVSTGNIRQSQFAEIVNSSSGNVSVISGMHGGPDGSLFSEFNGVAGSQLIGEDIRAWGNASNIKIYDISKLSAAEIRTIIDSSDVTVCGWCFSERSNVLIEALECGKTK